MLLVEPPFPPSRNTYILGVPCGEFIDAILLFKDGATSQCCAVPSSGSGCLFRGAIDLAIWLAATSAAFILHARRVKKKSKNLRAYYMNAPANSKLNKIELGTISVYFLNTLDYLVLYKKPGKFSWSVRRRQILRPWQWGVCSYRWGRWLLGEQTRTWVASPNRSSPSDWPNTRIFQLRFWWRSNTWQKHDHEIIF